MPGHQTGNVKNFFLFILDLILQKILYFRIIRVLHLVRYRDNSLKKLKNTEIYFDRIIGDRIILK